MAYTRIENKTPDGSIPYVSFPNRSLYIHGSTYTRNWRNRLISSIAGKDVLLLDPWKNVWSNYSAAIEAEIEEFRNLAAQGITSGTPGGGTGIVDGYTPMVIPDITNTPIFWENRNCEACDFKFFGYDSEQDTARHIILQLTAAITADPSKVVVYIEKQDWRINYSIFLKKLPKENFFGNLDPAINRLKSLMNL